MNWTRQIAIGLDLLYRGETAVPVHKRDRELLTRIREARLYLRKRLRRKTEVESTSNLVLRRSYGERVIIAMPDGTRVMVEMRGIVSNGAVRPTGSAALMFTAPPEVMIDREEIAYRRERDGAMRAHPRPAGVTDDSATAAHPASGPAGSGGTCEGEPD